MEEKLGFVLRIWYNLNINYSCAHGCTFARPLQFLIRVIMLWIKLN